MNPLLLVMNPRAIEECVAAIRRLPIRKAWLTGFTESQLESVIESLIDEHDEHTHFLILSDDGIPTRSALEQVLTLLEAGHPVVTGYSNLDATGQIVNIGRAGFHLKPWPTGQDSYDLMDLGEVAAHPEEAIPISTVGFSLTGMSRELWRQFPFLTYGGARGWGSDYSLSYRLQEAGIVPVAAREAFFYHVKERVNVLDREPRKRLLVGEIDAGVTVE